MSPYRLADRRYENIEARSPIPSKRPFGGASGDRTTGYLRSRTSVMRPSSYGG